MNTLTERRSQFLLAGVIGAYLVLALWFSVAIPPFEATDEISHFRFAKFLLDNHRLPLQSHDPARLENVVAHNPPFYYLAVALAVLPIDLSDLDRVVPANPDFLWGDLNAGGPYVHQHTEEAERFPWKGAILALHIGRMVSVVAGAVSVFGAYRIGRRLLGARPALLVAGATAFLPSFLFTSSTIHNDSFVIAFSILAIDQLMALTEHERPIGGYALAAAFIALAGLSKVAGFLLAPIIVVPLILQWRRSGMRSLVKPAIGFGATLAILSLPWVVWNFAQYSEPFGYVTFSTNPIFPIRDDALPISALPVEMGPRSLLFHTFLFAFGYMDKLGPPVLYDAARWTVAFAFAGVLAFFALRPYGAFARLTLPAAVVGVLAVAVFSVSLGRYVQTFLSGGHGRYLFPVLPILMAGLVPAPFALLPSRLRLAASTSLVAVLFALSSVAAPLFIAPGYAFAGSLTGASPAPSPVATFADAIDVSSASLSTSTGAAGDPVDVTITWYGKKAIDRSYQAFVQLVGPAGGIAGVDRAPRGGMASTNQWRQGTSVTDSFQLRLPASIGPGVYEVRTGFYLRATLERLPVTAGQDRDGAAAIGRVKVLQTNVQNPRSPLAIDFDHQIRLTGYDLAPADFKPGAQAAINLGWEALTKPREDYTFSVQLLSSSGATVAQLDAQPLAGALPTSTWDAGDRVIDRKMLTLPASLPAGDYRVIVVAYQVRSGARLATPDGDFATVASLRIGG